MIDMSGMMVFMVLGWIVLISAIIAGVWWVVSRSRTTITPRDNALAILRERYARGEISKEEYEARRRDLAA
jgi:putative membrane protein